MEADLYLQRIMSDGYKGNDTDDKDDFPKHTVTRTQSKPQPAASSSKKVKPKGPLAASTPFRFTAAATHDPEQVQKVNDNSRTGGFKREKDTKAFNQSSAVSKVMSASNVLDARIGDETQVMEAKKREVKEAFKDRRLKIEEACLDLDRESRTKDKERELVEANAAALTARCAAFKAFREVGLSLDEAKQAVGM
jgi:hypothetical protein